MTSLTATRSQLHGVLAESVASIESYLTVLEEEIKQRGTELFNINVIGLHDNGPDAAPQLLLDKEVRVARDTFEAYPRTAHVSPHQHRYGTAEEALAVSALLSEYHALNESLVLLSRQLEQH